MKRKTDEPVDALIRAIAQAVDKRSTSPTMEAVVAMVVQQLAEMNQHLAFIGRGLQDLMFAVSDTAPKPVQGKVRGKVAPKSAGLPSSKHASSPLE